jgi:hypothetical protein
MAECFACSAPLVLCVEETRRVRGIVYTCSRCGGLHGEFASRAEACKVVDFTQMSSDANDCYFDFVYHVRREMVRVHGWFNQRSRIMTQSG